MERVHFHLKKDLEPFVNCIMVREINDPNAHYNRRLYADGYPGIMFQQTDAEFYLLPKKKKLSELFLYGHTLEPISLDVEGKHKFVVVQLFPFAARYLLGVDPHSLNDDCYDLLQLQHVDVQSYHSALIASNSLQEQVDILSDLMLELIRYHEVPQDDRILRAIQIILQHRGRTSVRELREHLSLTERTLERAFKAQVGLSPKQFARIIQFQSSLSQLTASNYDRLIEVGLDSGFSDQSHFIRTFKKYTGLTPSYYLKSNGTH